MIGEVTGESIISAIARSIVESFTVDGAPPTIYKEQIISGFRKPSFFIWNLNVDQTKSAKNRYTQNYQMQVRYETFDNDTNRNEHLRTVAFQLLDSLSNIQVPIAVRHFNTVVPGFLPVFGSQLSWQIVEGILQVFATYRINLKDYSQPDALMQQLFVNNNLTTLQGVVANGNYTVGTYNETAHTITVSGVTIPQSQLNYSLLTEDSAVWDKLQNGDEVLLIQLGEDYFVLDTLNRNRLRTNIDGGQF